MKKEELEYKEDLVSSEEKLQKLKEKIKRLKKEKEEYLRGWQQERADFLNYKKDEEERIKEREWQIKKRIFLEFLKVLDDFERAEKELQKINEKNYLDWIKGVIKIKERVKKILEKEGVKEIEKKEKFLPKLHEAVEWAEGEEGKILEVFEKGYFLDKKLLRPAKVKVGKAKK